MGVASYFMENRQSTGMDMTVKEAYVGDVHTLVGKIVDVSSSYFCKTDTGYTQRNMGMAHILSKTGMALVWTRRVWRRTWAMYTFCVHTVIIFLHVTNTRMMSRPGENAN